MTPRELAVALQVSVATISRWRSLGCPFEESCPNALKGYSRPRYDVQAVQAWLADKRKEVRA